MEIKDLKQRNHFDCLYIGDNDDLIVFKHFGSFPSSDFRLNTHGLIVFCTEGNAQFDYDGQQIQLHKDDLFLYMAHSVVTNFMSTPDYNSQVIGFTQGELWNINMYGAASLFDLTYLKQYPKVHLTDDDVSMLDDYFRLLCRRMSNPTQMLYENIVRSLVSTMMLEMLSLWRRNKELYAEPMIDENISSGFHRRQLAEKFLRMVEQSDGRIRRVDYFASQLNVTPRYLSTLLMETMKRRPSKMIHLFTMKAIERRLRFTDMTMQEIANELNFANASFFGKYVKEQTGMTPMEYRRKYQK